MQLGAELNTFQLLRGGDLLFRELKLDYLGVMAIPGADYWLVDLETGRIFGADTTVIVPEVLGALAYDIYYDDEAAIEYGDQQGVALDLPTAEGLPVDTLDAEPRGYIAIDLDNGMTADAAQLRLVPAGADDETFPDGDEGIELAKTGEIPKVGAEVLEAEGVPFETVLSE